MHGLAPGGGFASVVLCHDGEFGWVGGSCAGSSSPSLSISLSMEQQFGNMVPNGLRLVPAQKGSPDDIPISWSPAGDG